MRPTQIDTSQALNGSSDFRMRLPNAGNMRASAQTTIRQRADLPPAVDSVSLGAVRRSFQLSRNRGSSLTDDQFNDAAWELFAPDGRLRPLRGFIGGVEVEAYIRVVDFGHEESVLWGGTLEFLDPSYRATSAETEITSPLDVAGSIRARPLIVVTDGTAITRKRLTVRDRTGHGFASQLIAVTPGMGALSEANYIVIANGLEQPFALSGGRLYFRLSGHAPPRVTYVDIYGGAGINNDVSAGRLDLAGVTADAGVLTSVYTTTVQLGNPLAPGLAWQPGSTYPHDSSRAYTFGLDGTAVRLVDREATGERITLGEDADAWILTSSTELQSIADLSLEVEVGYRAGQQTVTAGVARVFRYTLGDVDNLLPTEPSDSRLTDPPVVGSTPHADHAELFYPQWSFGDMTFPLTQKAVIDQAGGVHLVGTEFWHGDVGLADFPTVATVALGVAPTTGLPNQWYFEFPDGSFHDAPIPQLSISYQPKDTIIEIDTGTLQQQTVLGADSPEPAVLDNWVEVDPLTLEPLVGTPGGPESTDASYGMALAVVKGRLRDSEQWETLWSETVTAVADEVDNTHIFDNIDVDVTGYVQIAVGLEPVAAGLNVIDWGTLRFTESPVITLVGGTTPSLVLSDAIDAQQLDLRLRNATTGQEIVFPKTLCDAGGIAIDCDRTDGRIGIGGAGGIGPLYRPPLPSDGARYMDLAPGSNTFTLSGANDDATVEWSWRARYGI